MNAREQYKLTYHVLRWIRREMNSVFRVTSYQIQVSTAYGNRLKYVPTDVQEKARISFYDSMYVDYTVCTKCHCAEPQMPIKAVQTINGQRIGRSCNYYRCFRCGALNRREWVTGYPTRHELQKELR